MKCVCVLYNTRNDPSAGSPTDALLRLLFPLDHTVRLSFHRSLVGNHEGFETCDPVPQTHREVHR